MDVRERAARGAKRRMITPRTPSRAASRARRLAQVPLRVLACSAFAGLLLSGSAQAGDPWEFWPELNLYKRLGPTTRLYFVTAYATGGKESELQTLDVAGYFDVTLKPIARDAVRKDDWRSDEDWRNKRYLWFRVGYDHVFKFSDPEAKPEDRGIIALHGRVYLPKQILLELRTRVDLRWIGGDYSTRYRLRGELNRDFTVRGVVTNLFFQAEWFYDTRYDGWARGLYQLGAEITVTKHFRLEPSVARQVDRLPEESGLYAVALVARWFY